MKALLAELDVTGEKLLKLVALGLELEINALTALSRDGWHHMRVLRFPASSAHTHRGIGAHTDYGMLVIATQDEVGGLYIRPRSKASSASATGCLAKVPRGYSKMTNPGHSSNRCHAYSPYFPVIFCSS
ncbi:hypothetical protein [Pseudomonas sp. H2_E05]